MAYEIPPELIRMVAERRLIPFVGAGLSAGLGLPQWRELLAAVSDVDEDGPPFEQVEAMCGNNSLQIAEYLFLRSGGMIGPLRQKISNKLQINTDMWESAAHVELVNLCAPQTYTTNFDDLI